MIFITEKMYYALTAGAFILCLIQNICIFLCLHSIKRDVKKIRSVFADHAKLEAKHDEAVGVIKDHAAKSESFEKVLRTKYGVN